MDLLKQMVEFCRLLGGRVEKDHEKVVCVTPPLETLHVKYSEYAPERGGVVTVSTGERGSSLRLPRGVAIDIGLRRPRVAEYYDDMRGYFRRLLLLFDPKKPLRIEADRRRVAIREA